MSSPIIISSLQTDRLLQPSHCVTGCPCVVQYFVQWNLQNSNTQVTKNKFNLLKLPKYAIIYTSSVQGPQMPFQLVKDSTKGIVNLKRVNTA